MKSLTGMFASVFFVSAMCLSCSKDDDKNSSAKNYFKVKDKSYSISAGSLENYGMDTDTTDDWEYEGYNVDLALFSTGLRLETSEKGYLNVYGTGQVLYFEILTTAGHTLDEISYSFDASDGTFKPGTFDIASYSLAWDDEKDNNYWTEIVSGTLEVSKEGNTYELKVDCVDESGFEVTGYFKGPLQYFDYDSKKKSAPVSRFKKTDHFR